MVDSCSSTENSSGSVYCGWQAMGKAAMLCCLVGTVSWVVVKQQQPSNGAWQLAAVWEQYQRPESDSIHISTAGNQAAVKQQRRRRRVEGDDEEEGNEENDEDSQDENDEEDREEDEEEEEQNQSAEEEEGDNQQYYNQGDDMVDDYFDDHISINDDTNYDAFYDMPKEPGPPSLFPLSQRYILGLLTTSVALTLSAGGGTGGGGLISPIFILIMGLELRYAIPCASVSVLGAALASTTLNFPRRHPLADRPLIDWDLVLIMEPLTLVGALVGTLFHKMFSEKLLIVLLVLLLTGTAHMTLSKAMRMYRAEKRYIRHLRQSTTVGGSPTSFPKTNTWQEVDTNVNGHQSPRRLDNEERQQILIVNPDFVTLRSDLIQQEKFTSTSKIIAAISIFSVVVIVNILVGGGKFSPLDIGCGSAAFWCVHALMFAFLIASAWVAQTYVVARHAIKELVRFDYVHGDIKWDARSAIIYPALFVTTGFFAGTLGIGGGVITVPIMLAMGVHPAVVSATSSTMILFTSIASTSSYMVFNPILRDFSTAGFLIGVVSSVIGQALMRQARQATSASGRSFERNSFLAFAIGGVVLISAILMTVQYVFITVQETDRDVGGLCYVSS